MLYCICQSKFNGQRNNIRDQISMGYIADQVYLTVRLLGARISSDVLIVRNQVICEEARDILVSILSDRYYFVGIQDSAGLSLHLEES